GKICRTASFAAPAATRARMAADGTEKLMRDTSLRREAAAWAAQAGSGFRPLRLDHLGSRLQHGERHAAVCRPSRRAPVALGGAALAEPLGPQARRGDAFGLEIGSDRLGAGLREQDVG